MLYNLMACDPDSRAPRFFEMSQMSSPVPPCPKENLETDERIAKVPAHIKPRACSLCLSFSLSLSHIKAMT
jgi:hypothetical protein